MRHRRKQAFRPGTRKNHKTHIKAYLLFCDYFQLTAIDPDVDTLCLFLECLTRSLKSPKSVKNYFSSVQLLHNMLGVPGSAIAAFEVKLMLRSISLTSTHMPQKKLALSPATLLALCQTLGSSKEAVVFRCAILMAFFSFLRRSNLVPDSASSFDKHRHLCRGDVFVEDGSLIILIKWSKTLQCHERVVTVPLAAIPGHPMCPVSAYQSMLSLIPGRDNDPLFLLPAGVLTSSMLTKTFKSSLASLGLDPSEYSLHSLRRSGATFAFHCGVEPLLIKSHGDWHSDAFLEYLSFPLATKLAVTGHMARAIIDEC